MKAFFILLLSLFTLAATAQVPQPNILSLQGYGGNSGVSSNVSKQLDGGFIIGIGATSHIGNIDSLCTISGNEIVFMKYNSDGSILEWSKCYSNNFSDSGFEYMFSTTDGGYILGGIGNGESHEFLIHKEDAASTILWSKTYGDSAEAILESMMATADGGYIMAGTTDYTNVDFPIHYGSWMDDDIGVIKVDSNGNKVWSEVIGGSLEDDIVSVVPAPNNGCYIVATTLSNDHDCTGNHGGNSGTPDIFLIRLDSNGNKLWHDDIGGSGGDNADYAVADGKGGVIIAGGSSSPDGDRTVFDGWGCPFWLLEVDSSDHILWDNCYGGDSAQPCFVNAVCKAVDGSIWMAGVSSIPGGEVEINYGGYDAWFVHTDSAGNLLNAKVLGSHQQDEGYMVYPLSNGNVIAGGWYDTAGGAFSNITWYSGSDAFLTIFSPAPEGVPQINTRGDAVTLFPNPANEIVTVETPLKEHYTVAVTDVFGRKVYNGALIGQLQIPVRNWQVGMYYVQVVSSEGYTNVQKLIVR